MIQWPAVSGHIQPRDATALQLAPCGSGLARELLDCRGGFLWWYLDLVNEKGDGLVLIWSYGLPFLPGYASRSRGGRPQRPATRPSLNISTYRGGTLDFYLLQEFDPHRVHWNARGDGDRWQFGDSSLESIVEEGRRKVAVDLCVDVPMLDVPARIRLCADGPGCRTAGGTHDPDLRVCSPPPEHDWAPLLCNRRARASVTVGRRDFEFEGRLYHDRNGGSHPLQDQGIRSWVWGRIPLPKSELIYYVLDGINGSTQSILLAVGPDGQLRKLADARLRRDAPRRNLGGLTWWPAMTVERKGSPWLTIEHDDIVDSGPFYLRSLPRATDRNGHSTRGVAEVCEPRRIDLAIHRPLVRMRVHQKDRPNSMWLPLFTGPRQGRIHRLLHSLAPPLKAVLPEPHEEP